MQVKLERLRRRYRPAKIRLLFVGESPPASGRFFYHRDSGLYRAIRDTFSELDSSITETTFLARFQDAGCYLIDLCPDPVDHLGRQERRNACKKSEPSLSRRLTKLQPEIIVTLLRSIRRNVEDAAARAGWQGTMVEVPYPGRWVQHRKIFRDTLMAHLPRAAANVALSTRNPLEHRPILSA